MSVPRAAKSATLSARRTRCSAAAGVVCVMT
jgi:hypothetical protein